MGSLETDIALKKNKEIHDFLKALDYKENDVRLEYFQYMCTVYDRFHKGFAYMDFIKEIADKKLSWDILVANENYRYLFNDYLAQKKMESHFTDNSRRFLIDSWSIFEWTLTQLLYHLMTPEEIDNFLQKDFLELKKHIDRELTDSEFKTVLIDKLKSSQLVKGHITHQSINRRYGKIFKLIKSQYSRNIEDDRAFLEFLGTYRNGLHFNFVYSGKTKPPYIYKHMIFKFIDREPIQTPKEPWELQIIDNLVEITKEIIACINSDFIESKIKYAT